MTNQLVPDVTQEEMELVVSKILAINDTYRETNRRISAAGVALAIPALGQIPRIEIILAHLATVGVLEIETPALPDLGVTYFLTEKAENGL